MLMAWDLNKNRQQEVPGKKRHNPLQLFVEKTTSNKQEHLKYIEHENINSNHRIRHLALSATACTCNYRSVWRKNSQSQQEL